MNQDELDRLQGLCDGATAGPWGFDIEYGRVYQDSGDGLILAIEIESIADRAFIAAARTAMPALISEVRRLQERCEAAERDMRQVADESCIGDPSSICVICQCHRDKDSGECWRIDLGLPCEFAWRGPQQNTQEDIQ